MKKKAVLTELERTNDYVSGEQLSEILGVSRTAVWKQIKSLREQGYEIEAQPRIGYRLLKRPDLLLPAEIASGLNTTCLGQEVVYYPEVDSTNEIARQLALQGAAEVPWWWQGNDQRKGRPGGPGFLQSEASGFPYPAAMLPRKRRVQHRAVA